MNFSFLHSIVRAMFAGRLTALLVVCGVSLSCAGDGGSRKTATPLSPTPDASAASVAPETVSSMAPPAVANGDPFGGRFSNGAEDVTFPPRNEPFDFRFNRLEPKYRDQLRRPLQNSFVDIEGTIVWTQEYLRYRVNGCGHLDAINRVFMQIEGRGIAPVCAVTTGTPVFPPRNEPLDFRQRLEAKYRDELRRSASQTAVDIEGDIVWTQEYLRYRVTSCSHNDAIDKVMAQIDGRGVQPDCTPVVVDPVPPVNGACSYALLPPSNNNVGTSGGSFSVNVSVQPNCAWRLLSNDSWLTVNANSSGSAPVTYQVAANPAPNPGRTGRLSLRDGSNNEVATHTVSQAGSTAPPCAYNVSPTSMSVVPDGGVLQSSITPAGSTSCQWTAMAQSSFITIVSGGSGTGAGTVRFDVARNTTGANRTGTVRVSWAGGSQDITVSQGFINFTASFTSMGFCNVHTTCDTCVLSATTNVPSPTSYFWNLGKGITYTTTSPELKAPNWSPYCPDAQVPGTFPVSVTVTVTGSGGATAQGSGNVSVIRT